MGEITGTVPDQQQRVVAMFLPLRIGQPPDARALSGSARAADQDAAIAFRGDGAVHQRRIVPRQQPRQRQERDAAPEKQELARRLRVAFEVKMQFGIPRPDHPEKTVEELRPQRRRRHIAGRRAVMQKRARLRRNPAREAFPAAARRDLRQQPRASRSAGAPADGAAVAKGQTVIQTISPPPFSQTRFFRAIFGGTIRAVATISGTRSRNSSPDPKNT